MAAKVRIIQRPDGYYEIQKREWFTWSYETITITLEDAERIAKIILNPIVKEYE